MIIRVSVNTGGRGERTRLRTMPRECVARFQFVAVGIALLTLMNGQRLSPILFLLVNKVGWLTMRANELVQLVTDREINLTLERYACSLLGASHFVLFISRNRVQESWLN